MASNIPPSQTGAKLNTSTDDKYPMPRWNEKCEPTRRTEHYPRNPFRVLPSTILSTSKYTIIYDHRPRNRHPVKRDMPTIPSGCFSFPQTQRTCQVQNTNRIPYTALAHTHIHTQALTSNLATACFWKPSRVKGNRCAGRGTRASKSDTSSSSVTAHLTPPPPLFFAAEPPPPPVGLSAVRAKEPFVDADADAEGAGRLRSSGVLRRCSVMDC